MKKFEFLNKTFAVNFIKAGRIYFYIRTCSSLTNIFVKAETSSGIITSGLFEKSCIVSLLGK